jgi:hypothetical protein
MKFRKTWVEMENRILEGWSGLRGEQNSFRITPNKKKKNSRRTEQNSFEQSGKKLYREFLMRAFEQKRKRILGSAKLLGEGNKALISQNQSLVVTLLADARIAPQL